MTTLKKWPPYAEANSLLQKKVLRVAEITLTLDDQTLRYVREGAKAEAVYRAELAAERSRLRYEILLLSAELSTLKAQFGAIVHEDFLGEIKKVMNAAGIGDQYKVAFDKTVRAAQL